MQTIASTKANGKTICVMDAGMNVIAMATYILVSSAKEKLKGMVFINGPMERNMMGNGKEE